jgi:hypothetical protein
MDLSCMGGKSERHVGDGGREVGCSCFYALQLIDM